MAHSTSDSSGGHHFGGTNRNTLLAINIQFMGVTNVRGQYISHYKECKNKIKLVWRVVKYFIMNINTIEVEIKITFVYKIPFTYYHFCALLLLVNIYSDSSCCTFEVYN